MVTFLLDHNANPNLQSKGGITPLMFAVRSMKATKIDVIWTLLCRGADPLLEDLKGRTARILAFMCNGTDELLDMLADAEVADQIRIEVIACANRVLCIDVANICGSYIKI